MDAPLAKRALSFVRRVALAAIHSALPASIPLAPVLEILASATMPLLNVTASALCHSEFSGEASVLVVGAQSRFGNERCVTKDDAVSKQLNGRYRCKA